MSKKNQGNQKSYRRRLAYRRQKVQSQNQAQSVKKVEREATQKGTSLNLK